MKTYNNGPRKGMMYGGMSRRKPMMYGGTAMKSPRKKAQAGGMMSTTQPQQNMMQSRDKNNMQTNMMQMPKMAGGGKLKMVKKDGKMVPFYAADGKGKS
jgi:hypothetical protein|tara:strand:- start:428 stop:724 length:297 start_codon:yes stop_codon:yes gene_type:complete